VITCLEKWDYINDYKFMESWVYFRQHISPRGKRFVRQELSYKGIASYLLDEHFDELYSPEGEQDCLTRLVQDWYSRMTRCGKDVDDREKDRFINRMYRKGFRFQLIQETLSLVRTKQLDNSGKK